MIAHLLFAGAMMLALQFAIISLAGRLIRLANRLTFWPWWFGWVYVALSTLFVLTAMAWATIWPYAVVFPEWFR